MKGQILVNEPIVPNVYRMVIEAPRISQKAKPGQFILTIPTPEGERVPFTIADWDPEAKTITIFYLEAGVTTMKMTKLKPGDQLYSLVGPLGKPTELNHFGTVVLAGGCYGCGAIYPLARSLKNWGNRVIAIIEARTSYLLYNEEKLKDVADEVILCTSDGSEGTRGHAWKVVGQLIEKGEQIDYAYFVGCAFMMMMCSESTRAQKIKTVVSLNTLMVDGTGMCGGCRVVTQDSVKYACVDGPDFDGHQVNWDVLFNRKGAYITDESISYQFHKCKLGGTEN
ncbi:sulfide/dihydroorotate dehydrogenase-like FAD/NAD-binding protein [Deltaproteobacteria bacterium TL4]